MRAYLPSSYLLIYFEAFVDVNWNQTCLAGVEGKRPDHRRPSLTSVTGSDHYLRSYS